MSKSSKTLKECEKPDLYLAQQKATEMHRVEWIVWMRDTYTYATAVKMSRFMGFSHPNVLFYRKMREAGLLRKQAQSPAPLSRWGLVTDIDPLS